MPRELQFRKYCLDYSFKMLDYEGKVKKLCGVERKFVSLGRLQQPY